MLGDFQYIIQPSMGPLQALLAYFLIDPFTASAVLLPCRAN